ncbi:hypothetical protein E6Q11_02340 [Candidatus Dojkabacteria bacterium]|uniref:Uncharacterized protein n=1 Tax=Candidatus Dojkabacteria bacterium TaxID=2099670 RepID=A0A5C7J8V2_9BACT|nr:MAG: hypothetical protein E6Q11_02340 [Candidatus Dojkabacteria bacterium]
MANSDNEELIVYEASCDDRALQRLGISSSDLNGFSEEERAFIYEQLKREWSDSERLIAEFLKRKRR